MLQAILAVAYFYMIFQLLGVKLTVLQTMIMVLARECSEFFRITPGAFGIAEGVRMLSTPHAPVRPASRRAKNGREAFPGLISSVRLPCGMKREKKVIINLASGHFSKV